MATAKDLDKYRFVSEPNNHTECPICLETLKTPKCLPCLHTFCQTCLHEYILKTHNDKDPVTFPCPCCREELTGPRPDIPLKEWASKFPLNRFVISMIQSQTGPETKTQLCGPCERDGDTVTAKHWCTHCEDSFCDTCLKYHGRKKKNKSHKIRPIEDIQNVSPNEPVVEGCIDHEGHDLVHYCKNHEILCCKLCLLSTHQACKTSTVEEMAGTNHCLVDVEKMLAALSDLDDRANVAMISQKTQKEALDRSQRNLKEKVSVLVTTAKLRLHECHEKFNCKLDKVHTETTTELTENQNQIKNFRKVLTSGKTLLSSVKDADLTQKARAVEKIKHQMRKEIEKLKSVADKEKSIELTLKVSDVFEMLSNLQTVGELETTKESKPGQYVNPLLNATERVLNPAQQKPDIEKIKLIKVHEITTSETNRRFTGGVFLKDDGILFADNRNKKLRLYDSSGKLKYEHALNYQPWDVALGNASNKVLVSGDDSAHIRSYIISETGIKEGPSIKVSNKMEGIDTIDEQIICLDGEKVEVINYNGIVSKVLQMKCDGRYICTCKTKSQFYCSHGDTVARKSLSGVEEFVYSHPELESPRGIAVDKYGTVFICGHGSNNVHIVSEDRKQSVVISSKTFGKITSPYSIGFNNTEEMLFITSYALVDPIEIYKVKYD